MLVFAALTAVFAYAGSSIGFRDGLARAFEGRSAAFREYREFSAKVATGESDLLVLVENVDLTRASHVGVFEEYILEALLLEGVTGVASVLSFDPEDDAVFQQIPEDPAAMAARIKRLRTSQPALDRFLNRDEKTALIVLATDNLLQNTDERSSLIQSLNLLGTEVSKSSDIDFTVTGYPAIGHAVLVLLFDEFIFLNLFGVIAGTLVATLAFRNWRMGLLVATATGFSLIWSFGLASFFEFELNIVTIILPTLVMALSFADATHLGLEIRKRFLAGEGNPIRHSIRAILPAGILASLTTATAFGVLQLAPSNLLQEMGFAGLLTTLTATATVFLGLPLLIGVVISLRGPDILFSDNASRQLDVLSFARPVRLAVKHGLLVSLTGIAALGVSVFYYLHLPKDYSLYEGLSGTSQQMVAMGEIERTLSPAGALHFTVSSGSPASLKAARDKLARAAAPQPVYSIFDLADPADRQALDALPVELKNRFFSTDGQLAVLTTPHVYDGSKGVLERLDEISARLVQSETADGHFSANGFLVMTSRVSTHVLSIFGWCFAVAAMVCAVLITIWLGNLCVGLISMVPNLLPITLFGAGLYLYGGALNYTISVALTISFGIAVDDTIHMLNRLRNRVQSTGRAVFTAEDVAEATRHAAPAMTITTLVLSIGVSGALLSEMPSVVSYGQLVIITFVLALALDLFLLPAMLATAARYFPASLLRLGTWPGQLKR